MPVTGETGVNRFGASSWNQTGGAGAPQSVVSATGASSISSASATVVDVSLCSCHWGRKGVCSKKQILGETNMSEGQVRGSVLEAREDHGHLP